LLDVRQRLIGSEPDGLNINDGYGYRHGYGYKYGPGTPSRR